MILVSQSDKQEISALLEKFGMKVQWVPEGESIPGSFWGDPEAGLIGNNLYLRPDTPLQSALHEACHYICMDETRRKNLHTTSGGDYDEENAVCYLQILLADEIAIGNRDQMMNDMDEWGYSFRLGSAKRWFHEDASDAKQWLINHHIINEQSTISWKINH